MNLLSLPPFDVGDSFDTLAAAPTSWAFDAWKVDDLRAKSKGEGVTCAILDTGIDATHPEFADGRLMAVKDFTGSASGTKDRNGHGTHCSATVGGHSPKIGVANSAKLLHGKVLGDSGSGSDSGIAKAIDWAVGEGADVISMSLGSQSPAPVIKSAIDRAASAGVWVVAAAGNEGNQGVGYPGRYETCIDVAAIDRAFKVAGFSSRGAKLDTSGPGVDITSARPGGGYTTMSGTSMATPFIAGLLACYRSALKKMGLVIPDVHELRKILMFRSVDLGTPGDDPNYGPGYMHPFLFNLAAQPLPPMFGEGI